MASIPDAQFETSQLPKRELLESFNAALSTQADDISAMKDKIAFLMAQLPKRSKVYVPLFMWPYVSVNGVRQFSPHWQAVIDAKRACPDVVIYACINVGSGDYFKGPGLWDDNTFNTFTLPSDIATAVSQLLGAGVEVGVYLYSGYGTRPPEVIRQRIDLAKRLFPQAKFIFVDEEKGDLASAPFYRAITDYAKSQGFLFTVGNPGMAIQREAVGACDVTMIYEEAGLPSASTLDQRTFGLDKKYFGAFPHSVTAYDPLLVKALASHCGLFYLTEDSTIATISPDKDNNPWNTTTKYLPNICADSLASGAVN